MSEIPTRKRNGRRVSPTTAQRNDRVHAETQEKRKQALALRVRGMSVPLISQQIGVSVQTAYRYIEQALADIPRENAEKLLSLELSKLDARELQTQQRLLRKDLNDTEFAKLQLVLSRIAEQRARLKGLYAPAQHEVSVFDRVNKSSVREMSDDELLRIASGDFSALAGGPQTNGVRDSGGRTS